MANRLVSAMHDYKVRSFPNLDPPLWGEAEKAVGNTGSSQYKYKASFVTICGETTLSEELVVSGCHATLSQSLWIRIRVASVPEGVTTIRWWKWDTGTSTYKLLGTTIPSVVFITDYGQALTTATNPSENTSGRADFLALGYHPGEYRQRQEGMDDQSIKLLADEGLWTTIFRDGDIISGLQEKGLGSNQWQFLDGEMYLWGRRLKVTGDTVTLTGSGTEVVGILPTTRWVTPTDDPVLTAFADEGQPPEYSQMGADRLVVDFAWVIDEPGMIKVKEFINGVPKTATLPVERTELDRRLADMVYSLAGNFVSKNFTFQAAEHPTDADKLILNIRSGEGWVQGYKSRNDYNIPLELDRGRGTRSVADGGLSAYTTPGGSITTENTEPFNVAGLNVKLKVGSGNSYTVALSGSSADAATVAAAILAGVNASATLVTSEVAAGKFTIRAVNGKDLTIETVASDAYTALGWSGTKPLTKPTEGTRVYSIGDSYIKTVSENKYDAEFVVPISHNPSTHRDYLGAGLSILCVSDTEANAHDGISEHDPLTYTYNPPEYPGYLVFTSDYPSGTYYVKYTKSHVGVRGVRKLVKVMNAEVVRSANASDALTYTYDSGDYPPTYVASGSEVPGGMTGTPVDVVRILRVTDMEHASEIGDSDYTGYRLVKNSTATAHEASHIDWSLCGAAPDGQPAETNHYFVSFLVWQHATEGDFVSADSYDLYSEIEWLGTLDLRDAIDFRTVGGRRPLPSETPDLEYEHYLQRIDKIMLDSEGGLAIVKGEAALFPKPPQEQSSKQTLAVIKVSPYTYHKDDVTVISMEPLRMTQEDMRDVKRRVERLEYRDVQKSLESEITGHPLAVDNQGIFTDAITGFKNIDLGFNVGGVRHSMAVDLLNRTCKLRAQKTQKVLTINDDPSLTYGVRQVGDSILLDFTTSTLISQPYATTTINVNPDNVLSFSNATIGLSPAHDTFIESSQAPALNTDFDLNLAPFIEEWNSANSTPLELADLIWGDWRLATPTDINDATAAGLVTPANPGAVANATHTEQAAIARGFTGGWREVGMNAVFARTGTLTANTMVPERRIMNLGERIVDMSVVPMMRTTDENGDPFKVHITGRSLKPLTDHACTIAGKNVSFVYDDDPPVGDAKGSAGANFMDTYATVKTDEAGSLTGYFVMPAGVPVGEQPVTVFSFLGSTPTPTLSGGAAAFFSQGFHQTKQTTTVGFDSPVIRNETQVLTEAVFTWGDPIAESILVSDSIAYICCVNLYFASKSDTIPVTVEMREMFNGYPTRKVLASCTLDADDIETSTDGSVPTSFFFENVLGYRNNEYCFVAISNCNDYEVYCCELGGVDLLTGAIVEQQPYDGVLFHSPNNSTWAAKTRHDLKFDVLKSNFEDHCHIRFDAISGLQASAIVARVNEFLAPGTNARWFYRLNEAGDWIPFHPSLDITLQTTISTVELDLDVTSLGGSYQLIHNVAGILLLLHEENGYYVGTERFFDTDSLTLPNSVRMIIDADADGSNGIGVRSLTPYYTVDNGVTLVELTPEFNFSPASLDEYPFARWEFATPEEQSVTGATNATPIVIASSGNRFTDGALVVIDGVVGNTAANGTFRVGDADDDGFALYDPDTGGAVAGNGAYESGGTIVLAEYDRIRAIVKGETSNQALSPQIRSVSLITARL